MMSVASTDWTGITDEHSVQLKLPGILGGLGPLAHIEFEQRLIHHSAQRGASRDQAHPSWLLINATSTPDRTRCLLGTGENCIPELLRSARLLESMGAHFLVVTCNTAHAFYQEVQPHLTIPWLHMMDITTGYISQYFPDVHRVGVLATDGTLRSQLYTTSLARRDLVAIVPPLESALQKSIMQGIYAPEWGIKSSGIEVTEMAKTTLLAAMNQLGSQGAELVIAGCTEVSIGLAKASPLAVRWIDPLDIIANLTLDLAYGLQPIPVEWQIE